MANEKQRATVVRSDGSSDFAEVVPMVDTAPLRLIDH
jgi:hypothetical protein